MGSEIFKKILGGDPRQRDEVPPDGRQKSGEKLSRFAEKA